MYQFTHLGPIQFKAAFGLGMTYSPAVGGGVNAVIGGDAKWKVLDSLVLTLPFRWFFFSDGSTITMLPGASYKAPFWPDYELMLGYRADMQMLNANANAGNSTMYYILGIRKAI